MDRLFPREFQVHTYIVLRFSYSASPESQIVLSSKDGQEYEVFLGVANKNVHGEVGRMVQAGEANEQAIASKIQVHVRKLQVPKEVTSEWLASFAKLNYVDVTPVATNLVTLVTVDGTVYFLWYQGPIAARLQFECADPFDGDEAKSHPVVRWMNRIKAETEKYAKLSQ